MVHVCQNDDVADYERVYSLGMLQNHPHIFGAHTGKVRAAALAKGWTVRPEPRALRLRDKTGTARAYIAFDDGPGYIEWAAGDGWVIPIDDVTAHPPTMWLYVRDWLDQLPQKIKPAMGNTGQLDALPIRPTKRNPQ